MAAEDYGERLASASELEILTRLLGQAIRCVRSYSPTGHSPPRRPI
jgi:hypothetical protein